MRVMATVKESSLTHRQRQALQTRQLIVDAARSLFVSQGYAETSLEAVAEMAGVAPRTVYSVFGTKKSLLGAICEAWLAEAGIPEAIAEGLSQRDLRRRLLIVARASRRQWELERGTCALLQGAAASDAEVARMLSGWKQDRASGWRQVVDGLESQLRPDVDPKRAVGLIRALTTWETYLELVPGEGWTADEYEKWLAGMLTYLLLPPAD